MSTEHSLSSGAGARVPASLAAPLARAVTGLLTGLLIAVAVVLIVRRLAGALEHPLSSGLLAVVAVLSTAAASVAQRQSPEWARSRLAAELTWFLPAVALLPIVFVLTLPGTSWVGLAWLWLVPIAGEAALSYRRFVGSARVRGPRGGSPVGTLLDPQAESSVTLEPTELEPDTDPQIKQHITRRHSSEGDDLIEGWLRTALMAGQRTAHAHVSFCPPFASVPELEFEQTDGPMARVKLGQVLAYGARFEVKLDEVGPAEVLIAFSARGRQFQK